MQYWLMKSEPGEFSISNLKRVKKHCWDGVRNYEARNFMRDRMQIGDLVIFYHSNGNPSGAAGVAKVASLPYPDHTQFDQQSPYFDPASKKENPKWVMVDVDFVRQFQNVIPRQELKNTPGLEDMILWKRNRLSISPLTKKGFEIIERLGKKIR